MNDEPNQQPNSDPYQPPAPSPYPEATPPQVAPPNPEAYNQSPEAQDPHSAPADPQESLATSVTPPTDLNVLVNPIQPVESAPYPVQSKKSIFSLKSIIAAILILIILIVIGVTAYVALPSLLGKKNSGSSVVASCTPLGGTLDDVTAKKAYKNFVAAIKKGDQGCVDQLSTNVLKKVESQTYGASDGKWLNKQTGSSSAVDDIKSLPDELNAEKIVAEEYTRSDYTAYEGLENSTTASGVTVKYPLESNGKTKMNASISFVSENNKILADNIQVAPEGFENF